MKQMLVHQRVCFFFLRMQAVEASRGVYEVQGGLEIDLWGPKCARIRYLGLSEVMFGSMRLLE